jgi:hypothetical protein
LNKKCLEEMALLPGYSDRRLSVLFVPHAKFFGSQI